MFTANFAVNIADIRRKGNITAHFAVNKPSNHRTIPQAEGKAAELAGQAVQLLCRGSPRQLFHMFRILRLLICALYVHEGL